MGANHQALLMVEAAVATPMTWNSADKGAGITLSNGDLDALGNGSANGVRATRSHSTSGKYYFEVTLLTLTGGAENVAVGVATAGFSLTAATANAAGFWGIRNFAGHILGNGTPVISGVSLAAGGTVGIAVDFTAGTIYIRYGTGWTPAASGSNPSTNTNPAFSTIAGTLYPYLWTKNASGRLITSSYVQPIPTAYAAW